VHPTFFEATTAIAFELFRRANVQVAVIEVGLGGRYDSTNIITPAAAAITSIAFDHQQFLGNTLEAIAFEKAGIIKPGIDVVIGALPEPARMVVDAVAKDRGATVIDAAADARVTTGADGRLLFETPGAAYGPVSLGLRGDHQVGNALVAIRLVEAARSRGIAVPDAAIEQGLVNVRWPARLELIPVEGGREVLLDAAHNVEGARALAGYLRRHHPDRPALVLGVMRDKDVEGIVAALMPVVSSVFTTAANTPRALPAHELAVRIAAAAPSMPLRVEPDPAAAVAGALQTSATVCVAGSIFVVGAVRDGLRRRAILR
jgi:dihydrofolate synthase/folylpolyglutamate synthase